VQYIDSEVALKLVYLLLPAEVIRCLVGECNVIQSCGWRYTQKGAAMLRLGRCYSNCVPRDLCASLRWGEGFHEKLPVIAKLTLLVQLKIST
jgi:hypothetical protein